MAPAKPPRILRWALRGPTLLYRVGAGRLLGHRFLMLTHRGRRTGRLHHTVLEVVSWRPQEREAVVVSGFGKDADWYRNVVQGGAVGVEIDGCRWHPEVRTLEHAEAAAVIADYERRNRLVRPVVRKVLSRLARFDYDGSEQARLRVAETLPLVGFRRYPLGGTLVHAAGRR